MIVGGPSITDPIERSKGFQYSIVSFHKDRKALEEYQASKEHHRYVHSSIVEKGLADMQSTIRVTSTYLFPYEEDRVRFDFEVAPEDEYMCTFDALAGGKTAL